MTPMAHTFNARLFVIAFLGLVISSLSFSSANAGEKNDGKENKKEKVVESKRQMLWFSYTSDSQNPSDLQNPSNYIITNNNGSEQPDCPAGDDLRCAVQAPRQSPTSQHPDLSGSYTIVQKAE